MTFSDSLYYVAVGNPFSKSVIGATASILGRGSSANTINGTGTKMTSKAVTTVMPPLWKLAGNNYNFIRLAGISGASAVILGAIGSHKLNTRQDKGQSMAIFEVANRFHFYHSLALICTPFTKRPFLTGGLMFTGTLLFCGTLYYRAYSEKKKFSFLAPIGGSILIISWLSMLI